MKIFPTAINPLGQVKKSDPNEDLVEPGTDYQDRRNYSCDSCGRAQRKMPNQWRCPDCGYAKEVKK